MAYLIKYIFNLCPYCSGRQACMNNNLAVKNPDLAKEWHPTKNVNLNPEDVLSGSHKRVWWLCNKNKNHIWEVAVVSRTIGNKNAGCPFCSGNRKIF